MAVGGPRARLSALPIALAAVSFFIFASAGFLTHLQQRNEFMPERSSLAAAVSNVVYHAPLGKVYAGVLARFLELDVPFEQSMAQAARGEIPPGELLGTTADGNGIGYMTLAAVSMRLFGTNVTAPVIGMFILMGISAFAFIWRFRARNTVVVVLYFSALTVMLFTSLSFVPAYIANFVVGGIRYFSLVGILPAYHLLLECTQTRSWEQLKPGRNLLAMTVQVVILILAILVRNAAFPLIAAIAAAWLLMLLINRRDQFTLARLTNKAAAMVLIAAAFVGILVLSLSKDYLKAGRFSETIWHRVFVSLGVSPEWPFGNLSDVYDCSRYGGKHLVPGTEDWNGLCVFLSYMAKNDIPFAVATNLTYGREYDAVLRQAFFDILFMYPKETLRTFYYYKPRMILSSLEELASINLRVSPVLIVLFFATFANLLAFALVSPLGSNDTGVIAGATVLFAVFSTIPYIAVWAMPHTSGDLLCFCLFGLGLLITTAIERIRAHPPSQLWSAPRSSGISSDLITERALRRFPSWRSSRA
jgi:hypothetical protein